MNKTPEIFGDFTSNKSSLSSTVSKTLIKKISACKKDMMVSPTQVMPALTNHACFSLVYVIYILPKLEEKFILEILEKIFIARKSRAFGTKNNNAIFSPENSYILQATRLQNVYELTTEG